MAHNDKIFAGTDGQTYAECSPDAAECWIDDEGNVEDRWTPGRTFPVRRIDVGERVILGQSEAVRRLPDNPVVKVASEVLPGLVTVANWRRPDVIALMRRCGVEEAGPNSAAAGFGMACWDGKTGRYRYVETTEG